MVSRSGVAPEFNLKIAVEPTNDLISDGVALHFAEMSVFALARIEKQFRLFAVATQPQLACLLSHFERLHEFGNAHFLEAALNDSGARSVLLHFFQVQAVHDSFYLADQVSDKKRLGNKIFHTTTHRGAQFFLNIAPAGDKHKWNIPSVLAAAQFFKQLPAVQAGHPEIGDDQVWRIVDGLEQRVRAVTG